MALTATQRETFYLLNRVVGIEPIVLASISEAALALHMSHDGLRSKLYTALRAKLKLDTEDGWWSSGLFIIHTFDSNVVYEYKEKTYRQSYVMTGEEPVLSGEPTMVELSYVDLATESALPGTVKEGSAVEIQYFSHVREDEGDSKEGLIRVIAPGQGTSGYYPNAVLKRDGPKVFTKGLQMFWNHATETMDEDYPIGDLNRQAGILTGNAYWDEKGPVGPGIYAPYHAFEDYKPKIHERVKHNAVQISWKGTIGYTEGQVSGRPTKIVQSLQRADSVDFVTLAGAGGAIARASESRLGVAGATRRENTVPKVEIEDTELTRLRGLESKATETLAALETANKALVAARESAATAIINVVLATKQIPDKTKESWTRIALGNVVVKADQTIDAPAFESFVKDLVAAMPDAKSTTSGTSGTGTGQEAGSQGTGTTASENPAAVNLGGGGFAPTNLSNEQAITKAKEMYVRRGYKPEVAEKMARG